MKHLPLVLLIAAGLWLASVALRAKAPTYHAPVTEAPTRLPDEVPAGFLVRSFAVQGMCCPSCARGLHERLMGVEGVQAAAVDFDASSAQALAAETLSVDRLLEALEFGKYSARSLP